MSRIGVISMVFKKKFEEQGIYATLEQYKKLGFSLLEISQLDMTPANIAELQRAAKDFGIAMPVITAPLEPNPHASFPYSLTGNLDQIIADCKALGATIVRIGSLPFSYTGSAETYMEFAKKAEAVAEKLDAHGIKLYYHNHNWEFVKFDGSYGLDIIYENSGKLGFELDVHWIWKGGEDPVKFIRKYNGRVDLIHLKDYRIGAPDREALESGDIRRIYASIQGLVQFAEIGEGTLPFKDIMQAGLECNAKYFFIEQDDTYGRDIMESLKISLDNIRRLGYGYLL